MKKLLYLILCMMMIVTVTSCGSSSELSTTEADVMTAETTEPETAETTEPVPTVRDIYNEALNQLDLLDAMTLTITVDTTTTLGTDSFSESNNQTLILQDIGTDSFAASLSDTVRYGNYCVKTEEIFYGGNMYYSVTPASEYRKVNYASAMSAEEYLDRMIPARLLDSDLYETVEQASEKVLTFANAAAPEEWLGIGETDLVEASGVANLGDDGGLSRLIYNVTYKKGSAVVTMKTTVKIASGADVTIAAPEDAGSCLVLEGDALYGPYLLHHAIGYLSQMDTVSSHAAETVVSMAGGCFYVREDTLEAFSDGDIQLADNHYVFQMMDLYSGECYFDEFVHEDFEDGLYTYTYGNEVPQTYELDYSLITSDIITDAVITIPYQIYVESFEVGNYGGTILVEYQLNEAVDDELSTGVAGLIYNDSGTLNNAASAYRTDEASGYIGIDAATGIPTAVGMDYVGVHTIEGEEYELTFNLTQNFQVGHDSTYEAITGEKLVRETEKTEAAPLFYKVTGADGQEMWLFGTIHIGDERTSNLPQEIADAFNASDALAVEFDTNAFWDQVEEDAELAAQLLQMYMYTDGTATQDHIADTELYEAALKQMKAAGLTDSTTLMLKPSIWSQYIDNYNVRWNYDLSSDNGMDEQLLAMADEQEKEVLDVESGMEQLQMLTGFSDGLQELLLAGSLSTTPSEYVSQVNELYELWCSGDEAALIAYLNDDEEESSDEMTEEEKILYEEYEKAMYTDRNAAMLETAKEYLESGDVVFFAVGLAHLLAEDGLVNTLRDAGYTVELVSYK